MNDKTARNRVCFFSKLDDLSAINNNLPNSTVYHYIGIFSPGRYISFFATTVSEKEETVLLLQDRCCNNIVDSHEVFDTVSILSFNRNRSVEKRSNIKKTNTREITNRILQATKDFREFN